MNTRVWPIGPILAVLLMNAPADAVVFQTCARVNVVSGVEIQAVDLDGRPGWLQEAEAGAVVVDPESPGPLYLRINGPADLRVHVALKTMRGEALDGFEDPEDGLHGPGGDLMIELDALPAGAVADRRPLLLYLEYE